MIDWATIFNRHHHLILSHLWGAPIFHWLIQMWPSTEGRICLSLVQCNAEIKQESERKWWLVMLILSLYFSPFEIRKPGILTWTHPELRSVVTVAKKRLFSLSHCQTMVPACSSNSKRYNTRSLLGELSMSSSCLLWIPFFTSVSFTQFRSASSTFTSRL